MQNEPSSGRPRKAFGAFLAIGAGVGTAIGVATHNIAIGVGLGVAIGVAMGLIVSRNNDKR